MDALQATLEQVIAKWRKDAEFCKREGNLAERQDETGRALGFYGRRYAFDCCADELSALLSSLRVPQEKLPDTTRIIHSAEIADDPGGFAGDYVPLEDHIEALTRERASSLRVTGATAEPRFDPLDPPEWKADCLHWRGRELNGRFAHWCLDWDGLPIDETCPEWPCGCPVSGLTITPLPSSSNSRISSNPTHNQGRRSWRR